MTLAARPRPAASCTTTPPRSCRPLPHPAIRQLAVTGLGHDQPTLLITNDPATPRQEGRRVLRPADEHRAAPRRSHPVLRPGRSHWRQCPAYNVNLDVVLSVLAHTICAALRRRLPGYHTATPDALQRRFLNTGGIILNRGPEIVIRLDRRTYSPVLRQATLPQKQSPCPGGAASPPSATSTPDPKLGANSAL